MGDKYVMDEMMKNELSLGGEQSGHIIFGDYAKTGDGLVSALQVLALLMRGKKASSILLSPFELYPQKLINLSVSKKTPLSEIDGVDKLVGEIERKGIRVLVRYSGTENKLRILMEGKDAKSVDKEMERAVGFFEKKL